MKLQTCCFTGHRKIPTGQYDDLRLRLDAAIEMMIGRGYRFFGVGGALGFDTMAALSVIKHRERYPHIKLILVLPCVSQAAHWTQKDQRLYRNIMAQANKVAYVSQEYTRSCMLERNRHLVDCSSACICYLTELYGGTAYTVQYAEKRGLKIINIAR